MQHCCICMHGASCLTFGVSFRDLVTNLFIWEINCLLCFMSSSLVAPVNPSQGASYSYVAPTTSPFYRKFLSPLCDWLCHNIVPEWVHPDQLTILGVSCASLAAFCVLNELYIVAGCLWMLYSLLDNMDGNFFVAFEISPAFLLSSS